MTSQICGLKFKERIGACAFVFIISLCSFAFAEKLPQELEDVGINEHLGSTLDLNTSFQDETGATVPLKKYFDGTKPVLFFLVYYECPNLCTFVLNSAVDSMKKMNWTSGKDFEVVALSFNPKETFDLAKEKKDAYLKEYSRPEGAKGWHFLVAGTAKGSENNVKKIADEIGFKYKWDPEQNQYAHASALFVLTGSGKISRYFYGIDYPPQDLKVAMLEAGEGKIGNIVDKILLFCYHYDSSTKKYVLWASRIMSMGGGLTVLILGVFLGYSWRREQTLAHS